jgi:hypothetical protein
VEGGGARDRAQRARQELARARLPHATPAPAALC